MISKRLHPASFSNVNTQLAHKVENFKLKNEVVNGDFSQGTAGWNTTTTTGFTVVGGIAEFIATAVNGRIEKNIGTILANEKYYTCANVKADSSSVSLRTTDLTVGGIVASHTGNNTFKLLSGVYTQTVDNSIFIRIVDARGSGWTKIYTDNIMLIKLTSIFGVGNEPTKLEMDELMKVIPNQWWDGELSLTQKQFVTWQLNLIRKNTNAIIALGGTIV